MNSFAGREQAGLVGFLQKTFTNSSQLKHRLTRVEQQQSIEFPETMTSLENEARPATWDRLYEQRKTPWRSDGLSIVTSRMLASYANGRRLLEIGCGTGEDATSIVDLGFEYHGLDVSEAAISSAKDRLEGAGRAFSCSDFFSWPAGEPFDVIYDKGFFHGLAGTRRRNTFVRRVASQLVPHGLWISVCGSADQKHENYTHGAIYLRDLVGPAEVYFEVLEIVKDRYGLADQSKEFSAWHSAFRRY
jgi:2-polyprenyl-3-methyl-5-hydroxy-6-metoxy-1,4-benzoquinol methylase